LSALLADLLLLPGLGALASGRRLAGLAQAALALTGFGLALLWLTSYGLAWLRAGALPEGLGPRGGLGLAGLALFLLAWLWSLAAGLGRLRALARRP
jgi:hypothetical protein